MMNIYVLNGCRTTNISIFAGGFQTLTSITAISVALVGFALLYRYRESLKENSPYAFYGLVVIVLLVGIVAVSISASPVTECWSSGPGVTIDEKPGMVTFTIVSVGNLDGAKIVGPEGKRSTETRTRSINGTQETISLQSGTRITLRSNEEVIDFLNNTNITVPTASGIKTVENVSELPSEYQKAPDGFVDPDADIGNYDNASVATVACLYRTGDFEIGERNISAGVSIPCSTPILAQNDIEDDYLGTHVKPGSGPNKGKTLVSPVTFKKGEYQLIGIIEGQETVVQTAEVTDEIAGGEG